MNGVPKYEFDRDAMGKAYSDITGRGLPFSEDNIIKFVAGLLTSPEVAQAIRPPVQQQQPTGATNLPTQPTNQPKVGPIDIPSMHDVIVQMYRLGDISYEQAVELGKQFGVPL